MFKGGSSICLRILLSTELSTLGGYHLQIFLYPLLSNLIQTLSVTQIVSEATRVNTNGTTTLIDLALVSTPSLL